ncbi:MAG: hypothetical protein KAY32_00170 [Candidatus Eisenbacteria sp.]|nr:hypothetical protein [Candidatus Eisenbacteria bacterium]
MGMLPRSDRPLWTLLTGRTMLLAGLVGIALLVLISFPIVENPRPQIDPAADAEAAYLSLLAQISPGEEIATLAQAAAREMRPLPETTPAGDSPAAELPSPGRRDLFAPLPAAKPTLAPVRRTPAGPTRPRLPHLAGILIDGASRRAMLGGELVTIGDEVDGYRLIDIEEDCVTLEWRQKTYQLELGAK